MLLKVISYRHQAISAGFHLNTCTNIIYHYWLQAFAGFQHLIAGFAKTSHAKQITIATLVVASLNIRYIKSGLRYLSHSSREVSHNIREPYHNSGELSPNLWDLSRGLGESSRGLRESSRDLGEASPRLRYRYLSLFYLYRRLK